MIQIGKHQVGPGSPPFIIAEVGSNWASFEDCKNSIALAKACGADAVKFQLYDYVSLYGPRLVIPSPDLMGTLPREWLPKLKEKADACGIEFMCTAFSPELYDAVDPYVSCHKVASAELTHVRILEKLRKLGKPVILSTGASGEADIRQALHVLTTPYGASDAVKATGIWQSCPPVPVILMYCVAAYPAWAPDLSVMAQMRDAFGVPVGYSDHTTSATTVPQRATDLGAVVIEKHVNFVNAQGPDSAHSLDTEKFKLMVKVIRGTASFGIQPHCEETPMILRHNRRLIATRDIAEGEQLKEGENFGIYRSLKDDTSAASPWLIDQLAGRFVKRAIPAGDGIAPGDV